MSLVAVIYISSALICGTLIGLLVTGIVAVRRLASISENVSRIEIWTADLLRAVDPTNPRVGGFMPYGLAETDAGSKAQSTVTIELHDGAVSFTFGAPK